MTEEWENINKPSCEQLKFIKGFTILPNWMIHDPEDYVKMFHDQYYVKKIN